MDTKETLAKVAEESLEVFSPEYVNPENRPEMMDEGLGIRIAGYADWDGIRIMKIFHSALEDANFHREAAVVRGLIEKCEKAEGTD